MSRHIFSKRTRQIILEVNQAELDHLIQTEENVAVLLQDDSKVNYFWSKPKIQQIKMLVMCQSFGDLFLFGLVWDCFTNQNQYKKLGSKS